MAERTEDEQVGLWLHAVVRDGQPERLTALSGLDGAPVRAVTAAGLAAVVSPAPLAEYGEEPLRRRLEDLDWLEVTARAHHWVVDALARTGPVVPSRLATVYRDEGSVTRLLRERGAEFTQVLDRVTGRSEWGVKAYADPQAVAEAAEPAEPVGAGTAYLRRRRAQLSARDAGQRAAAESAARVHELLSGYAVAARRHAPQDRRLSGDTAAMVLNGAYLVDTARLAEFTHLVESLPDRLPAVRLQLTGPWPPYSFTADPLPGTTEEDATR